MKDDAILAITADILEKSPHLLGQDRDRIAKSLKNLPPDDPTARRRLANLITTLADDKYPDLLDALYDGNATHATKGPTRGGDSGYEDLAGNPPGPVPSSAWLRCPKPGCPGRKPLRTKGQRAACPECGTLMKPEHEVTGG